MKLFSVTSSLVAVDASTVPTRRNRSWSGAPVRIWTYLSSTITRLMTTLLLSTPADTDTTEMKFFKHHHLSGSALPESYLLHLGA